MFLQMGVAEGAEVACLRGDRQDERPYHRIYRRLRALHNTKYPAPSPVIVLHAFLAKMRAQLSPARTVAKSLISESLPPAAKTTIARGDMYGRKDALCTVVVHGHCVFKVVLVVQPLEQLFNNTQSLDH